MLLRKIYEKDAAGRPMRVKQVVIGHTGTHAEQSFSAKLVMAGLADGWVSLIGDTLTLKAYPEDLVYTVKKRGPIRFDCVLEARLHETYRAHGNQLVRVARGLAAGA